MIRTGEADIMPSLSIRETAFQAFTASVNVLIMLFAAQARMPGDEFE